MTPRFIEDVDTPAVLVDVDRVEANLARAQAYADSHNLPLRPHIKTHKLPVFARRQVELGAVGITCQKLGEAEVMADGGQDDIFISYNLLGEEKMGRLARLMQRVTMRVAADNPIVVGDLAKAAALAGRPLDVVVECDTGRKRSGVESPADAIAVARAIKEAEGLSFAGFMLYPPEDAMAETQAFLDTATAGVRDMGLEVTVVSSGGTPNLVNLGKIKGVTEHRAGTCIFNDRMMMACGAATLEDCALTVLATVVSRPTDVRAVLDAGSKSLTSDTLGMTGFGAVDGYPQAVVRALSEEHGQVHLAVAGQRPHIGERVRIVPNHACVISNLFDRVHLVSGDRVVDVVPVAARGRVD